MRAGNWLREDGMQLTGKTLGLIGFGGIAAEVARIALGSGMRVIAWNRACELMTGVKKQDILGHRDEELFPPETTAVYLPALQAAFVRREIQTLEGKFRTSACTFFMEFCFVPLVDQHGKVRRLLSIVYDIGKLKEAEAVLQRDKDMLARLVTNRTYVGEVCHKDKVYPGEQEAIIDRRTWDKTRGILATNHNARAASSRRKTPALLSGLIGTTALAAHQSAANVAGSRRMNAMLRTIIGQPKPCPPRPRKA